MTANIETNEEFKESIELIKQDDPNLMVDEETNKAYRSAYMMLPASIRIHYGCMNCEWRDANECFFGFKPGSKDRTPKGICEQRIRFLSGFVIGLDSYKPGKQITFSQWQSALLQVNTSGQHLKDQAKFSNLQREVIKKEFEVKEFYDEYLSEESKKSYDFTNPRMKLSSIDDENHPDALQYYHLTKQLIKLNSDLKSARSDWQDLIDSSVKQNKNHLDREQPKQVDVSFNNIGLANINKLIAGNFKATDDMIIDAEFKELIDDDEDEE